MFWDVYPCNICLLFGGVSSHIQYFPYIPIFLKHILKYGNSLESNNFVNDLKPIFPKFLNFVKTAPNALPAAPANTFAVTLKSRYSSRNTPKYLYCFTISSYDPSNINFVLHLAFLMFLKCITFVLSLFTHSLHLLHHKST